MSDQNSSVAVKLRAGFSLVELMIVVAIIGVLAAIAVPSFIEMQLKAKRAELPGIVDSLKTAELAYDAAFDAYLELPLQPRLDDALDKQMVDWTTDPSWQAIGWGPDGKVRGNYQVGLSQIDHPGVPFLVTGRTDIDGDDALCEYTATDLQNAEITPMRQFLY
ncbi:MAG: prepilin-type N-terminal cleavage/methylation domain-containing protein [Pseudomonadota bacterium]|nr:prepilin-type N-terminal cleavage/methylation domain-containing protein [Pseudomonadota bacterium]